ncbi:MAG: rhomboid family intramembrane serine protease [Candidatus Brocadiales bacterium]
MIPFKDKNPSSTFPYVTVALIGLNGAAFIYEISLGDALEDFIFQYGVVPIKVIFFLSHPSLDPAGIRDTFLPFLTSMFLHGGPIHILGNMWYLWLFGDNVEDRLGHFKFIGFYLLCGIIASAVHVAANPSVGIPCVGASGAIAGVLGAYMITFPKAKVLCVIPLGFIWQVAELPAVVVLGFWFVIQFFNGAAAFTATTDAGGGVAWWAHIGGFVFGIVLMFVLPKRRFSTTNIV